MHVYIVFKLNVSMYLYIFGLSYATVALIVL